MASPRHFLSLTTGELEKIKALVEASGNCPFRTKMLGRIEKTPRTDLAVLFTISEARTLHKAASNTVSCPDAMEANFDTQPKRDAAYRASQKLNEAIQDRIQHR